MSNRISITEPTAAGPVGDLRRGTFWSLAGFGLLALLGLLALPETLPSPRRNPQPLGEALVGYLALARSPRLSATPWRAAR